MKYLDSDKVEMAGPAEQPDFLGVAAADGWRLRPAQLAGVDRALATAGSAAERGGGCEGGANPQVLEALQGRNLLSTDGEQM